MKQNTIKKITSLFLVMIFIIVALQSREVIVFEADNLNKKPNSYILSSPISPQKIDDIVEKYKKDYNSKIECLSKSEEFKDLNLNITYHITINNTIKKETKVKTINYTICKNNNCKAYAENITIYINLIVTDKKILSDITFESSKNLNLAKCNIIEKQTEIIDNLLDYNVQEQNIVSKYVSLFNKTLEVLSNHTNSSIESEFIIIEKNPVNYVERYYQNYTEIIYYICDESFCNASNFKEFKFIILLNDTIDKFEIREFYIHGNISNKSINFKEDPLAEYMKFKGYYKDPILENKLEFLEKKILFDLFILQNNLIDDNKIGLKNNAIVNINLCKKKFDLKPNDKKSTEESIKKINEILKKHQLGFNLTLVYSDNPECYNSIDDFFDAQKKIYYAKNDENIILLDKDYYYSNDFDVLDNLFIKIPLSEVELAEIGKEKGRKKTSLIYNNNLLAKPPLDEEKKTILLSRMRNRDTRAVIHLVDKMYVNSIISEFIRNDKISKNKIIFISNNLQENSIALFPNYDKNKMEKVLFLKKWNSKDIEYGSEVLNELKSNREPNVLDLKYLALGLVKIEEKYTPDKELPEINYKLSTQSFIDYADSSKNFPTRMLDESKIYLAYVFNFLNQAVDFPLLFDSIQKKPFEFNGILTNFIFDFKKYYDDVAYFCNDNYLRYNSIYSVSFALSSGVFLSYYDFISENKKNKEIFEKNREIVTFFNPLLILSLYIADYAEYSLYLKNYNKIPKTYMYHLNCPITHVPVVEEIVSFFRNNIINMFFKSASNIKTIGLGIDSASAYLSTVSLSSIRKTTKSLIEIYIKELNKGNIYYICGNNFKEYSSIEKTIRLYKGTYCDENNPFNTYYVELVLSIYNLLSEEFKKIINYKTNQEIYANYYKELEEKTKSNNDAFFVLLQCYSKGLLC
ncbi:MAG: hypothetical protein QXS41_01780 [Candidatus Woesearchaeota archaeon]